MNPAAHDYHEYRIDIDTGAYDLYGDGSYNLRLTVDLNTLIFQR